MTSAREARSGLLLLTGAAVDLGQDLLQSLSGSPEDRRKDLLGGVPEVIGYYADGSSALAADFYEDARERAGVESSFTPELVIADRTEKIRRAIVWAADPLFTGEDDLAPGRLAQVIQLETARPFRDTITTNRRRDPEAVGWRRVTVGGCKFCQMLAGRGAIYRHDTVRFAAHPNCHCGVEPVFGPNDTGVTASVEQYQASKTGRTAAQNATLRDYLNTHFPDVRG